MIRGQGLRNELDSLLARVSFWRPSSTSTALHGVKQCQRVRAVSSHFARAERAARELDARVINAGQLHSHKNLLSATPDLRAGSSKRQRTWPSKTPGAWTSPSGRSRPASRLRSSSRPLRGTRGSAALTMHANYFGDTLLFTGWTLASSGLAVSWTWWAVPVMTALFVFMHIPVRAPRPGSPSYDVAAMAYKWHGSVTASPRAGPRRVPRGPLPEGIPEVRLVDGEVRSVYLLSSRAGLGKNPTPCVYRLNNLPLNKIHLPGRRRLLDVRQRP